MNHLSQMIVLVCILLLLVLLLRWNEGEDGFINYPRMIDPTVVTKADPDQAAANQHYAALLLYLQKKPSAAFLDDIKQKFFTDSCTVKSFIDVDHVAEMPHGMVF